MGQGRAQGPAGGDARRAVVVREGPPRHRGLVLDWVLGVLGLLLLVGAAALVPMLPEEETVLPQFRLTVRDGEPVDPMGPYEADLEEDASQSFSLNLSRDNIFEIELRVSTTDDNPASDPDRFVLVLEDPDGERVWQDDYTTAEPELSRSNTSVEFVSPEKERTYRVDVAPRPEDHIVDAASKDETVEDARGRVLTPLVQSTHGTWTLRITLQEAGDCPNPDAQAGSEELARAAECRRRAGADPGPPPEPGEDRSNSLTVHELSFNWYVLALQEA